MAKDAITCDDSGTEKVPETRSDWDEWVSASATRNHVLGDPLLDWLDRHGESKGFARDVVDERTDFATFIMRKGIEFEQAVVKHLEGLGAGQVLVAGAESGSERPSRDLDVAYEIWEAMRGGVSLTGYCAGADP